MVLIIVSQKLGPHCTPHGTPHCTPYCTLTPTRNVTLTLGFCSIVRNTSVTHLQPYHYRCSISIKDTQQLTRVCILLCTQPSVSIILVTPLFSCYVRLCVSRCRDLGSVGVAWAGGSAECAIWQGLQKDSHGSGLRNGARKTTPWCGEGAMEFPPRCGEGDRETPLVFAHHLGGTAGNVQELGSTGPGLCGPMNVP